MTSATTTRTRHALCALGILAAAAGAAHATDLRVVAGPNPDFLDPALARDPLALQVMGATQGGLLAYRRAAGTTGATLVPDLAASMPATSRDGLTLTFTLRGDVRFAGASGRAATASDAKASIERMLRLDPRAASLFTAIAGAPAVRAGRARTAPGIRANDSARRLVIRLTRRDPALPLALALPFASVLPAGIGAVDQTANPPAGIGAYAISDFRPGERIVLTRNRSYVARTGLPAGAADRIVITLGRSTREAAARVAAGQADYSTLTVSAGATAPGGYARGATPHQVTTSATAYVAINAGVRPFTNPEVRRAVGLAIDRGAAARAILRGAVATGRMIPSGTPGHSGALPARDTARARALVSSAGATGARVVVWTGPSSTDRAVARAATEGMRAAGLSPVLRALPRDGGIGAALPRAVVASAVWTQSVPDGSDAYAALLGQRAPEAPPTPPVPVISGNSLLRAQARAASLLPLGSRRAAAWSRVDAAVVADGRVVSVATPRPTQVTAPGVRGVVMHPVLGVLLAPLSPPA
jgi:peptide/nickel transport system substrate-binding protein